MVTKESLYIKVQQQLLALIQDRQLKPHDALPSEGELAESLNVSRSSLREATRSLQSMGVLYAQAGKGLFLQDFSLTPILDRLPYRLITSGTQLAEVLQVRAALERGLIAEVASTVRADDLLELDEIVAGMYEFERAGRTFPELDRRFHLKLYERLDNSLITDLLEIFWSLRDRMQAALPPLQVANLAALHENIVIALRDPQTLDPVAALDQHFLDIKDRVEHMSINLKSIQTRDSEISTEMKDTHA